MSTFISNSAITVGSHGAFDISIPVITIGFGKPTLSIVTGFHGASTNEKLALD